MREKKVETDIKDYLFSKGAYYFKVHGSALMEPGIPDIIACYKGYFIGIEVKAPGKDSGQSAVQKVHEKNILKAGGIYILADCLEDVVNVVEELWK